MAQGYCTQAADTSDGENGSNDRKTAKRSVAVKSLQQRQIDMVRRSGGLRSSNGVPRSDREPIANRRRTHAVAKAQQRTRKCRGGPSMAETQATGSAEPRGGVFAATANKPNTGETRRFGRAAISGSPHEADSESVTNTRNAVATVQQGECVERQEQERVAEGHG